MEELGDDFPMPPDLETYLVSAFIILLFAVALVVHIKTFVLHNDISSTPSVRPDSSPKRDGIYVVIM